MSFYTPRPGEAHFNPVTDAPSTTKVQLVNGQAFGNDKLLEDAGASVPPVGKFNDGGAGFKEVSDGNRLGLSSLKRALTIHSFYSKNITGATLSKVDNGGNVSGIGSFPALLLPGEDLQFAGTASDADNHVAVVMSEYAPEGGL